ncbi:MAG TPA: amidohydrolase family protein [Pyrinomonadaceae bacterium]|nr:amidohydrolase family protein [Pyrinomonadaceae bacterium]
MIQEALYASHLLLFLFILPIAIFAQPNQPDDTNTLAFTHATVIDVVGAKSLPNMTVVIRDGRIADLGRDGKVPLPRDARIIDSSGKFLIPGLWDMHVHTSYKSFLTLFVANGITGVRDMGGSPGEFELLQQWRQQIRNRTLLGPHIVAAGIHVDGPIPLGRPNSLNVATENEAREAVDFLKGRGANFIKVYSMLPREAYFAIAEEARKQGLSFAGHVPASITAREAADAGQQSMEHLFGVLTACSTDESALWKEAMSSVAKSGISVFVQAEIGAELKAMITYDEKKATALFARFVENGTGQVPTLAAWRTIETEDDSHFDSDIRLKYMPLERKGSWKAQRTRFLQSLGAEYDAKKLRLFENQLKLVNRMHRAGVLIMTGTDSAAPYVFPGFSLHDELLLLVRAGLTPMEALQAATRNPAKFLGLLDSFGSIDRGKIANLVLLEANPLQDISNTQKIAAVVIEGQLLTKEALRSLLADASAMAAEK